MFRIVRQLGSIRRRPATRRISHRPAKGSDTKSALGSRISAAIEGVRSMAWGVPGLASSPDGNGDTDPEPDFWEGFIKATQDLAERVLPSVRPIFHDAEPTDWS